MNSTGSLVDNRSNPYIFLILGILLVVAAVLILIRFLTMFIEKKHSSPEWIEAQKKLPTTKKNIEAVARNARLTNEERSVLAEICKRFNAPNIEYLIRDSQQINSMCADFYQALVALGNREEDLFNMFNLRYKLEKLHDSATMIHDTRQLKEGQGLLYITPDNNGHYQLILANSDDKGMYLTLPEQLTDDQKKPAELSKIALSFVGSSGLMYKFDTRAIRYEKAKDGKTLLYVSHTSTLNVLNRRQTKRMTVNKECTFRAAKDSGKKTHNGKVIYDIMEKTHQGTLLDVSAKGCCIKVGIPILPNQSMQVSVPTSDGAERDAIGLIVGSRKTKQGDGFILNVKFTQIDRELQNRIYADVYGY
ncbi:MAG TPA: hypothetical protein DCQ43_02810 [Treponema sp.]|nr:hypothetical protein [Treponema sp.]